MHQSQESGFKFENLIKSYIFNLPEDKNNTDLHDIPKEKNIFDKNENISIKSTLSNTIYCGDIINFYNYNFNEKNTIILIKYFQINKRKQIEKIYEIDYNKNMFELLFGNLPKQEIEKYIENIKKIPKNINNDDAKKYFNYINEKDKLTNKYNQIIKINPKIDSKLQRRVQCSILNFCDLLKEFIIYESSKEKPNIIRDKEIPLYIESEKRKRNIK
jgi:hypothetical protein